MDDRPGIFERIPLFFLTIAALLLAAGAGIWLQGNQTAVEDECAKATLTRDDYEDDLVATDDDDCDDEIDLVRHKKNWRIPVAILQQHNNSDDTNGNNNGNNDTDDTDDTDDDSPPNGTYTDDSPDTNSGGNTDT